MLEGGGTQQEEQGIDFHDVFCDLSDVVSVQIQLLEPRGAFEVVLRHSRNIVAVEPPDSNVLRQIDVQK